MIEKNTSKDKKDEPTSLKDMNIIFHQTNKVDDFAYEIIRILFDVEELYISNLSELNDFLFLLEIERKSTVKFSDLSDEHKKLYPHVFEQFSAVDREKVFVEFPPDTDEAREVRIENNRNVLLHQIEAVFNISMKNYPQDEKLYVWKVAEYIKKESRFLESQL